MRTPLCVRVRSFFARDERAFWWDYVTNEEKQLRRMDVSQLAKFIINSSCDREKKVIAEHMLNVRLAKIQATASWGSGILGFVGALMGAALSIAITIATQNQNDVSCAPDRATETAELSSKTIGGQ